ncbi:hypothetical protein CVT24_012411 [Panaeolus cyanescens]|uniref:pyranose dehydrogenase (acceptor) n=1 Tax=Panaeolus cyanescens TaxID=181874 RepID=A0A409YJD6_9AGAR|nr:hypothetical protein CVT24_012411 [Panaeolus cyanescens]
MPWLSSRFSTLANVVVSTVFLASFAHAYPDMIDGLHARQISPGQLSAAYDYIVVGGGQSGLVIANRLSEDPTKSVLIVEYGYLDDNPAQLEPSSATQYRQALLFNATIVPQPGINNRGGQVYAASVVGGGSTVNGMLFDRGSKDDYDNWERLGNPGWGWDGLLPYFKKSTTFTPPRADLAAEYNITWDIERAYGNGPIQATFPDWQWPSIKVQWKAWAEVGVPIQVEGAAGDAHGAYWVPSNVDQQYRRSYARSGYFDPVQTRSNLKLLTGYRVNEVLFDANKRAESVRIQARGTANGAATITIKAAQEIVLCAGWLHTPQVLQRSGVGPASLLQQANIPVLVDLPGVGSNLQDHPAVGISYQYRTDLVPNRGSLQSNQTFAQWARDQWALRKGPSSMGVGNSLATIPWPILSPTYQTTIDKGKAQSAATYLPKTYNAQQVAGFVAQRDLLLTSFGKTDNGVVEIPFSGGSSTSLVLERPFSRGTVLLNPTDKYAEPTVDYNVNINPVDTDVFVAMVKFTRRWFQAPSHQQLTPVEQSPGTAITTDAQIATWAASGMTPSTAHSCGTSAMQPREQAGVVSPELLVYGVTGLSVGDISIIPMIPGTHTCATVYAIAEKAADLIKARYDPSIPPAPTSPVTTTTSPGPTGPTTTSNPVPTTTQPTCTVPKWGQCGGQTYTGCKVTPIMRLQIQKFALTTQTHGVPLIAPMKKYTRPGSSEGRITLLLAHGAGFFKETWEPVIEDLFELDDGKSGHFVVREAWALDCQNHGEACTLNEGQLSGNLGLLTIWDYADAFATLIKSGLLEAKDGDRHQIFLCGHSAGAVGVTLSTSFFNPPSRLPLSGLILIDPPISSKAMANQDSDMYRIIESTTPERRDTWDNSDAAIAWLEKRIPWAMWDKRVFSIYVKYGLRPLPTAYYPDKTTGVTLTTHRLAENVAFTGKRFSLDALDRLNTICRHLPVHLVYGDRNDMFEREFQDSIVCKEEGRTFASVTRLEDVGHLVVQEAPTALAQTLFSILTNSSSVHSTMTKL